MMKPILALFVYSYAFAAIGQTWEVDYAHAVKMAKEDNKTLVVVFSGSDWCAPCIKLDREIWQSEYVKSNNNEQFIFYKADFPIKKVNRLSADKADTNAALAARLNPRGHFPLVVVLDADGNATGALGYKKISPQNYFEQLNRLVP